ncbi:MAG: outer membrane protein OmpK [Pseudomonadota bacterium]|nr:outer membrane protein OmpK [Pseudomonadota bacterium]
MLGVLCCGLVLNNAQAKPLYQDFSVSYLNGSDYELGDPKRQVVTLEYAAGMTWGDTFFFIDRVMPKTGDSESYFEFSPRVSLSHLTGQALKMGIVKDVFLAGTWEANSGKFGFDNYLYGLGVSLAVPQFQYMNVNLYYSDNDKTDNDVMLGLNWGLPFKLGAQDFLYDGFVDWSSRADDHAAEMNFTSQLKWNAGKLISPETRLYLGIEYALWHNKFGIKDVDERNPSILIKYHF